jgi:hypothetical protein
MREIYNGNPNSETMLLFSHNYNYKYNHKINYAKDEYLIAVTPS